MSATPPKSISKPTPKRLWIGAAGAALLSGAGLSLWQGMRSGPKDEAVETLFRQRYPIAAGPSRVTAASADMQLESLRGKAVVLNFWATWCPPCIEEMPDLSKLAEIWQRDFPGKVRVIGLGIDSEANIQKFYQKLKVRYDLLAANAQGLELLRLLGNPSGSLPFSVIISPKGLVVERILGRFDVKKLDFAARKAAENS
jgi:thiol-disulfide isomerase/thioredoxin